MNAHSTAERLMFDFAHRTGITAGDGSPKRYLWTDAFAVCNFLGIFVEKNDEKARRLTLGLVNQVHHVLGRHRHDDPRSGWISGLDDQQGEKHPTIGGLRIGKELPERQPGEPYDEALEWERDGQYFHYLTKWMHALDRVGRVTGDPTFRRWSIELARTAHARFTYRESAGGPKLMHWKMSVDLSRPQVASMGHHDPLDGLITYTQLAAGGDPDLSLDSEIIELSQMCAARSWVTTDALGIGGLLSDACKLTQLAGEKSAIDLELLEDLLWSAARGLESLVQGRRFGHDADRRLAFRELGLSIGLHAVGMMIGALDRHPVLAARDRLDTALRALTRHAPLAEEIESFWLEPSSRKSRGWAAHRDINEVMLATSLAPEGFLRLDAGASQSRRVETIA